MGTAVNWDYVLNNPVRGVKMPERTLKRPHRFLTAEEVRRLIAASSEEPLRTIIILATMTGLRIGEILALRWGRIDLLRGTLRVAETCYKGHFGSPKTRASRREVPLAAAVVRELKSLYSRSTENSQEALVFSKSQGLPPAADNLRKKNTTNRVQESWSATNRLAYPPSHARHTVAFARNSFEGCTGSAWAFTHGDNSGHLYTRQRECAKRRCELARRAIVPNCSQIGRLRKCRGNGKSVSSVS